MQKYKGYIMLEDRAAYRKGYLSGYRAGYQDGKAGKPEIRMDENAEGCPLDAMNLSTRAYHCLYHSGCRCAGDAAKLKLDRIQRIRNLGKVSASEIARALERLGIHGTDWDYYL